MAMLRERQGKQDEQRKEKAGKTLGKPDHYGILTNP